MTSSSPPLPPPAAVQAFFSVAALEAGHIVLAERLYVTNADPDVERRCPALAFLLTHSLTGRRIVFDLGIRKDIAGYTPGAQKRISKFFPLDVTNDVADSLRAGGLDPGDVDDVILSHLHFDHVGDPSPFARATFLVGVGGRSLLEHGYPHDTESVFDSALLPANRTRWLDPASGTWHPVGPFARALDLLGDGSLYIVDAPGHVAGHINVLVRTRSGWLFLAGDTAHDMRLMTGERDVLADSHFGCAHVNMQVARNHMRKVQQLRDEYGVEYVLAHQFRWDDEHVDAYFPGRLA